MQLKMWPKRKKEQRKKEILFERVGPANEIYGFHNEGYQLVTFYLCVFTYGKPTFAQNSRQINLLSHKTSH